jgi:hypothetical protein
MWAPQYVERQRHRAASTLIRDFSLRSPEGLQEPADVPQMPQVGDSHADGPKHLSGLYTGTKKLATHSRRPSGELGINQHD